MKKIGIVMGSDSDLPVLEKAMTTLDKFGVPYEVHVYSAHRTPVEAKEFAQQARANGFGAIIAAAGKAENAALLAIQVLGASDAELAAKLDAARAEAAAKVLEKNKAVEAKYNH